MNWPAIKHISRNIIISLIPPNQTHEIVFRILTRVAMVTIILTSLVYVVYKEKYEKNLENIQRRHTYIVEIEPNLSYWGCSGDQIGRKWLILHMEEAAFFSVGSQAYRN